MFLKNPQYNSIMRHYDQIQSELRQVMNLRQKEVYDKLPELEQLDKDIVKLQASHARQRIMTGMIDSETMRSRIKTLESSRTKLLEDAGFPKDYLEPIYRCKDCMDTGFIGNKKCHCFKQAAVDLVYEQSNIKEVLYKENFDHFDYSLYSPEKDRRFGISPLEHIKDVVRTCKEFIQNFDTQFSNILFYGETGVGKTFLTNCIAKELLDNSHTVIYLTAFQFIEIFEKNAFHRNEDTDCAENMYDYIFDCDLLIIDDLGTEVNNSFVTSSLFLCMNERQIRSKSTVISTNLSLDKLQATYSERIMSRLISNYKIIHLFGEDIRIKKAIS